MALTPRIITRRTWLFAGVLFVALVAGIWAVAELAPQRVVPDEMEQVETPLPEYEPAPYRTPDHLAFQPAEDRGSDAICVWTADQVWRHYGEIEDASNVDVHTAEVAELTEAYIDLGCPARVHRGDWHINAEVLGVGLVYESIEPQAKVYDESVTFDPRADDLIPTATGSFEVLAPTRMCKEALGWRDVEPEQLPHEHLYDDCLSAFGR